MPRTISFNELRRIKDSLPEGSTHVIADKLNVTVQTVRNYFGGSNYDFGSHMGVHIEPGPDGGVVILDDPKILDMAIEIIEKSKKKAEAEEV
ncbi:MAG: DNA-binding protein [Bacteroidales bacterium]|nr:DNA-binding protein [Bacteroidales bacterium]